MSADQPLVTIGMSVFNAAATLDSALRSLLWQTFKNWELIVIDDGSHDPSADIVRSYHDPRITLISDGMNLGLSARLNQMVRMGKGRYFARMDADDIAYPDRLKRQVAFLETSPEIDLLGCGALAFAGNGVPAGAFRVFERHEDICLRPWDGFCLPHPGWVGRIDWFRKNPYDPGMRKAQDQELLLRTYEASTFACLPEILMGYRLENSSLKKNLLGRWFFCQALLKHGLRQRHSYVLLLGLLRQGMKATAEVFVLLVNASATLRQRRYAQLGEGDRKQWKLLWKSISDQERIKLCVE